MCEEGLSDLGLFSLKKAWLSAGISKALSYLVGCGVEKTEEVDCGYRLKHDSE